MPDQGNDRSPALTWPTADELARVHRVSGELLEHVQMLEGRLSPVYTGSNYPNDAPTFAELGALTGLVSCLEADMHHVGDAVRSLARVRDAACPT